AADLADPSPLARVDDHERVARLVDGGDALVAQVDDQVVIRQQVAELIRIRGWIDDVHPRAPVAQPDGQRNLGAGAITVGMNVRGEHDVVRARQRLDRVIECRYPGFRDVEPRHATPPGRRLRTLAHVLARWTRRGDAVPCTVPARNAARNERASSSKGGISTYARPISSSVCASEPAPSGRPRARPHAAAR